MSNQLWTPLTFIIWTEKHGDILQSDDRSLINLLTIEIVRFFKYVKQIHASYTLIMHSAGY